MDDEVVSRRGFIGAVAAGTALAWVQAHRAEIAAAGRLAATGATDGYAVLTAEQAAVLDAVTAQIAPTDDTPGAREAHVVRFIDRSLVTFMKDQRGELAAMLQELADETARYAPGTATFAVLDDGDQIAVLTLFERSHPESFGAFRAMTVLGMFSQPSYGGNFAKSGWKMLGFEDRFAWTPPFGDYDRA